jgi:hypothetical protein
MTNPRVLAVDQSSTNNRQLVGGPRQAWAADVPGSNDRYVALFNRDGIAGTVSLSLSTLGIGAATVTDLWSGADLGTVTGTLTRSIPAHGAGLYRLVVADHGAAADHLPADRPARRQADRPTRRSGGPARPVRG